MTLVHEYGYELIDVVKEHQVVFKKKHCTRWYTPGGQLLTKNNMEECVSIARVLPVPDSTPDSRLVDSISSERERVNRQAWVHSSTVTLLDEFVLWTGDIM